MLFRSIESLDLSNRVERSLSIGQIYFVKDLIKRSEKELRKLPNFGPKSLTEVKNILSELGEKSDLNLYLGMKINWPSDTKQITILAKTPTPEKESQSRLPTEFITKYNEAPYQ